MIEIEDGEDGEEVVVGYAFAAHGAEGIGVDDLLTEGSCAEVGSLWNVENLGEWWFADRAAIHGP